MTLPYTIQGTIDSFAGDKAVIRTELGETFSVPKKNITQSAVVGSKVFVAIFSAENLEEERKYFAKKILNEMLGGSQ